jgi:regulator of protease activity HflC (stomatin/prohibitin superfamily)
MSIGGIAAAIKNRVFYTETVTEGEVAFLFVDGRFERVLPAGRHRLGARERVRVERVPLAEPRVTFAEIDAIKDRDDVRQVTAAVHVDAGRLGLAFRRGVFVGFLAPGPHVFVRPPEENPFTFDLLTPVAGAELQHAAIDAIVRHPEATKLFKIVPVDSGSLGLLYIDGVFARSLEPGRHVLFETGHALRVDIARPFEPVPAPDREALLRSADLLDVQVSDHERGLVFAGDVFRRFLAPGTYLFLKPSQPALRVELVDIRDPAVKHPKLAALVRAPDAPAHLGTFAVTQGQTGLLFIDGVLAGRLGPGLHSYWIGLHQIAVRTLDLREQGTEIQGQELLTADKVSLRLNVSVRYRIVDVDRAVLGHADHEAALHRCLQLALREAAQRLTVDELLSRKEDVGATIASLAKDGAAALGVELGSAGLRDVILPGEMRQILNKVVEAERKAQANLITRREETAATRSLLNTARLLDENPTLMRLKELEHAERIAEKIAHLSVVGGIDALLPKLREAVHGTGAGQPE